MADTAMGPSFQEGSLEALKYAAKADVFQDDPNFYEWLEDWIGKQDEEAVMIDAFNTLNDYGMQFEFQQQQQQQHLQPEIGGDATTAVGGADAGELRTERAASLPMPDIAPALTDPMAPNNAMPSGTATTTAHLPLHVQLFYNQPQSGLPCGGPPSSSASLASRPSHPSSDTNSSFAVTDSPTTSFGGERHNPTVQAQPPPPPQLSAAPPALLPSPNLSSGSGLSHTGQSLPTPAQPAAAKTSPFLGLGSNTLAAQTNTSGPARPTGLSAGGGGGGAASEPANPFGTAAFTHALGQGLNASAPGAAGGPCSGLLADLQSFLRREKDVSCSGSSLKPEALPYNNTATTTNTATNGPVVQSHGTVSSFVGAPPPQAAATPSPPAPTSMQGGGGVARASGGAGGGLLAAAGVGVPSLEQLIVRAICGNGIGTDLSRAVGGGAAGGMGGNVGLGSLLPPVTGVTTGAGSAAPAAPLVGTERSPLLSGAGLNLGLGLGFARMSTGSVGEDATGCGDSRNGSATASRDDFGATESMLGAAGLSLGLGTSLLGMGSGGTGGGGGGSGSGGGSRGASGHRYRRKSSCSGLNSGSQGSSHGIPVSHTHGHGHVGKIAAVGAGSGWVRGAGGAAGAGGAGGGAAGAAAGGGGSGGRLTRSARAKAVFAALEAEVAGKMGELETLQRENASLAQRVEILEVAVERQNVVLGMLSAAKAAGRGLAGLGAAAAGFAAFSGLGGGAAGGAAARQTLAATTAARLGSGPAGRVLSGEAATMVSAVTAALSADSASSGTGVPAVSLFSPGSDGLASAADAAAAGGVGPPPDSEPVSRAGSCAGPSFSGPGSDPNLMGAGTGSLVGAPGPVVNRLSPGEVLAAGPGSQAGAELLEWARKCTPESYIAWYKEHLQNLSMALLALEDSPPNPEAETRLVQLVAACWVRNTLTSVFQPLTMLRLKGLNLEANVYSEPSEQHWMDVIKFMTVSPQQVAEMENLFHSYNLLHESFRAELQDTQRDLADLVRRQDTSQVASTKMCSGEGLSFVLQQTALLKRVRSILQKTHLLYSCTIGVAAMRILKPKEFAKCMVQSYPYYPCGPSLMKACAQLRALKAIWGVGCGC